MKLNKLFIGLGVLLTPVALALTLTACSSDDKFASTQVGDDVSISSKDDRDNLLSKAKTHILTYSTPGDEGDNLLIIDQNARKTSTQLYWELIYILANSWSKGHNQTLGFTFQNTSIDKTTIVDREHIEDGWVRLVTGVSFKINYGTPYDADDVNSFDYDKKQNDDKYCLYFGVQNIGPCYALASC